MPHLPTTDRLDRNDLTLPEASNNSFWLNSSVWQVPDYDNADTFVKQLVHDDLLSCSPLVYITLNFDGEVVSSIMAQSAKWHRGASFGK